ncbi:MAG: hypothetical protein ACC642_00315 [Pseudomonadales bacterium]
MDTKRSEILVYPVRLRMVFDYRIRRGVVTRSNTLDLMRSIGLKV